MEVSTPKRNIIFVGAFQKTALDGAVGGQLYACTALLNSPITNHIEWMTIDSTMESLPPPHISRRILNAMRRIFLFLKLLRTQKIDGIFIFAGTGMSFLEKGLMAVGGSFSGKTVVFSPRSGKDDITMKKSRFMRWYIPFVLGRCSIVLCQGQYWKDFYQSVSKLPEDRLVLIKNWIETAPYAKLRVPPEDDVVNVLFMGWIERHKGIYDLVEAVHRYRDDLQNTRFIICGQGSQVDLIQQRIEDTGLTNFFDFRGWVYGKEKMSILEKSDIFVLPSYAEGMPNALLEAMAAGRAVIATRVGGVPDLIVNENVGVMVVPQDVTALGKAIVKLRHNPKLRLFLGENARKHVQSSHNINIIWPQVLQLFRNQ